MKFELKNILNSFYDIKSKLLEYCFYGNSTTRSKSFLEKQHLLIESLPDSLPEPDIHFSNHFLNDLNSDKDLEYEECLKNICNILKEKLPGTSFIKSQKLLDTYFKNIKLIPINKYYETKMENTNYYLKVIVYDSNWRLYNKPSKNTLILDVLCENGVC